MNVAIRFLQKLQRMDPDDMDFGDEPAFIIERITVFPNSKVEVILADGDRAHFELCRYSPILGWRCKEH